MGTYLETGSADTILEAAQPAVAPGSTRLQGTGQQPVAEAQDGTWIVLFSFGGWQTYTNKADAYGWKHVDPHAIIGQLVLDE